MGIDCTPEELARTVEIVKAGLAKGQSICHIWSAHPSEMCCEWRTFYDYVDKGVAEGIINLDLPMKVRFRPRKKAKGRAAVARACAFADGSSPQPARKTIPCRFKRKAFDVAELVFAGLNANGQFIYTSLCFSDCKFPSC